MNEKHVLIRHEEGIVTVRLGVRVSEAGDMPDPVFLIEKALLGELSLYDRSDVLTLKVEDGGQDS